MILKYVFIVTEYDFGCYVCKTRVPSRRPRDIPMFRTEKRFTRHIPVDRVTSQGSIFNADRKNYIYIYKTYY